MRIGLVLLILSCVPSCIRRAQQHSVAPSDPSIRYVGWFDRREPDAVRFAWPGSLVEVAFAGTRMDVELTDTPVEDPIRETDWLTIRIDDTQERVLALREGRHAYRLVSGLAPGPHRVLLAKRTEAEVGVVTLHGFVVYGGSERHSAAAQASRSRRLVFIGDSITAGYGNEGADPSCPWSAAKENALATYGAYAARELDADYLAAAWSGKGLTRNYEQRDRVPLPRLWSRVIPTEADSPDLGTGHASAVIINLGTNDFARGVPNQEEFLTGYRALLADVRRRFPGAAIVLGLGPLLIDDPPRSMARTQMRSWLGALQKSERHGPQVSVIEFWMDPDEGAGCAYHPNTTTHARMGRELAAHLRSRLGW